MYINKTAKQVRVWCDVFFHERNGTQRKSVQSRYHLTPEARPSDDDVCVVVDFDVTNLRLQPRTLRNCLAMFLCWVQDTKQQWYWFLDQLLFMTLHIYSVKECKLKLSLLSLNCFSFNLGNFMNEVLARRNNERNLVSENSAVMDSENYPKGTLKMSQY